MLVARYETRSSDRGAFVLMEQGLGSTKDSPSLAEKGRRRLVVVLAVPLELQLPHCCRCSCCYYCCRCCCCCRSPRSLR